MSQDNDIDFHRDIAICAAFIQEGMMDNATYKYETVLECWSSGSIELADEMAGYPVLAATLLREVDRFNRAEIDEIEYPGVYAYEVCSPFGTWFAIQLVETGKVPNAEDSENRLLVLAREFFDQCKNDAEKDTVAPFIESVFEKAMRSFSGGERGYVNAAQAGKPRVRP